MTVQQTQSDPCAYPRVADTRVLYLDTSFFIDLERKRTEYCTIQHRLAELVKVVPLCCSFILLAELASN